MLLELLKILPITQLAKTVIHKNALQKYLWRQTSESITYVDGSSIYEMSRHGKHIISDQASDSSLCGSRLLETKMDGSDGCVNW